MTDHTILRPNWRFWLISIIALLWNAAGAANYVMQTNPETLASMPELPRYIATVRPAWATAGFAVAVFGGVLGCLLLLLRRRAAVPVFILSLGGVLVQMVHTVSLSFTRDDFGSSEIILYLILPLLVALLLWWYANTARLNGWLR